MLLPLSEPVPLLPGAAARLERVRQPAGTPPPARFLHFHGPAELVLIEEGSGEFLCEGAALAFAPGTILYTPSMVVHDFALDDGPRSWTLIQFDPYAAAAHALPAVPLSLAPGPEARARIVMLVDWLASSIAAQAPQGAVTLQLQALMLAVAQSAGPAAHEPSGPPGALYRFRPLLDEMNREPGLTLRLAEAASLCAMAPSYFSRCFAKAFGEGFVAYQNRLKLLHAARLLATSDACVSQIGYRLGFRSHAYFSHCFKTMFGVPPSRHRNRV